MGTSSSTGRLWRARKESGEPLRTGEPVEVEDVEGLGLVVKPAAPTA